MFQRTLTEDHWQGIPTDVRICLGLPLGTVQDFVLSTAARKACWAREEANRVHSQAFAAAEAAQTKAATSHAAAERRTRAAGEVPRHAGVGGGESPEGS